MNDRRLPIGRRPAGETSPETWVRQGEATASSAAAARADVFTARLTVDITAELRGRIKVAAFTRGVTVAELLRGVLEREFASNAGAGR